MQALTTRLDSPRVVCDEKATAGDKNWAWSILDLRQHNVECPQGLFLARFQFKAEASQELFMDEELEAHNISYHYQCCKFIL